MPISRRNFLRDAFVTSVSAGLLVASTRMAFSQKNTLRGQPPTNPLDIPLDAQKEAPSLFTESTFKPYVGDLFQAPNARGDMINLRLLRLEKHAPKNRLTKRARTSDSFSLVFKAADELPPFTSIHTINHRALGNFDLFLTLRRDKDKGQLFYEAVINHVR